MLIKEYRIPLPLTVEEYRIAQLYMIAKKSRDESQGEGSGVEIIVNEPYDGGPGGKGQYTRKIYHVGSHLPGWIKSLLPKSALTVEEEAWNAYPYTKTRYTCPFVEKFSLEIETCYLSDNGYQENVFKLDNSELKNRVVDIIDIVRDPVTGADYCKEEDPCIYVSEKTKRGPLTEDWIETYWNEVKGKKQPTNKNMSLMCAYKLCRVEFRYWGMQTKLEKFIHDIALRKTMVKAHRQAWAWQDEWCELTMEDIREIEKQTQLALQKKMGKDFVDDTEKDAIDHLARVEQENDQENQEANIDDKDNSYFADNKKVDSFDLDSYSISEEEFFDCLGEVTDNISLGKWGSIEPIDELMESDLRLDPSVKTVKADECSCAINNLLIVFHGGSVLDVGEDLAAKRSDITTFKGVMEYVIRQHYTNMIGRVAIKKVNCDNVCTDILSKLSTINPYSFEATYAEGPLISDTLIGSIPLIATTKPNFNDVVIQSIQAANKIYQDFVKSKEGLGFKGHVSIIGDSIGSIIAYEALRSTVRTNEHTFSFDITNVFTFGSPLGSILSAKMFQKGDFKLETLPCQQFYNLFHPTDPLSCRIEPLMNRKMANISPVNIPRYSKYPKGHGQSLDLAHFINLNPHTFLENNMERRSSDASSQSKASGATDMIAFAIQQNWWGSKRIDYALYCPEGLSNLAVSALPHLFHSSYWESCDAVAFILRQIGKCFDNVESDMNQTDMMLFKSDYPKEKWIRKRTSVKLKNVAPNHRANDVIVKEGEPQKLTARFMYGPLDMITLAGEKVDIYIMKESPDWTLMSTEVTDKNGRIFYTISSDNAFGFGVYPVKMIVRGDQTSVEFLLAVVPSHTECVVFSIDGSFAASMSVSGKDPKVRPGAVDICRYWQDLGYLLIYITGRPDMQQHKVMSWLSQHNFPYGLLSFADGLSADPLGHKRAHLIDLIESHDIIISYAYGSNKDITVYNSIGLQAHQIFTVGKVNKKLQSCTTTVSDGYVAHLIQLKASGHRPVHGNARMVIPRDLFRFPGPSLSIRKQR